MKTIYFCIVPGSNLIFWLEDPEKQEDFNQLISVVSGRIYDDYIAPNIIENSLKLSSNKSIILACNLSEEHFNKIKHFTK